jgi:hypothetical protein
MNWLMIVGLVIIVIVAVAITVGVLFCGDVLSYTATGRQVQNPAGTPAGKALVVYSPGISGAAKNAAAELAKDLQSKGYIVNLAGIRSAAAANVSGYDVILVGGPMYFGAVSNSVDGYLKALKPQNGTALGVFATTGAPQFNDNDIASFGKQVASIPCYSMLKKTAPTKTIRSGDAGNADCSDLVSAVLP